MQLPSEPSISTLQSLLGACQIHGNTSITERVADIRSRQSPALTCCYPKSTLRRGVARRGEGEKADEGEGHEEGDRVQLGGLWRQRKFSSEDTTHLLTEEIYRVAEGLS
jgi:hypothetical protein